jgi:hypothetical protein
MTNLARIINIVPEEPKPPYKIDGIKIAESVTVQGKTIRIIRGSDIASGGRGWMDEVEQWAKEHNALLYDMEYDPCGDWADAIRQASQRGYDIVVIRTFHIRACM